MLTLRSSSSAISKSRQLGVFIESGGVASCLAAKHCLSAPQCLLNVLGQGRNYYPHGANAVGSLDHSETLLAPWLDFDMALASRLVRVRHGLGRLGHPCLVPRYPAAPTSTHAEARCHCRSPRFGGRCHRGSGRTISTDAASALKPPTPEEMGRIHTDIMTELTSANKPLEQAARYYFDGAGKLVRA